MNSSSESFASSRRPYSGTFLLGVLMTLGVLAVIPSLAVPVSIKDVARVEGDRDNQLIGYGLVSGLANQGDTDPVLTRQTVANLMLKFHLSIDEANIKAKNSAIVLVTAVVHGAAKPGSHLDVTVSSLADAKTLQGGTLMQTALMAADGKVYALAQGNLSIGGFQAGNGGTGGATLVKNHPTVGAIPGGGIIEREIPTEYFSHGVLEINLFESDFTTAVRMANAINEQVAPIAHAVSGYSVKVYVPEEFQDEARQTEFIARIENVRFQPDTAARIVMNERTGTIVANSKISIDSCAITHGNLTVSIVNNVSVSQPNPFTGNISGSLGSSSSPAAGTSSGTTIPLTIGNSVVYNDASGQQVQVPIGQNPPAGYSVVMVPAPNQSAGAGAAGAALGVQTAVVGQDTLKVEEEKKNMVVFNDLATVQDVAAALNAMGVTPRDTMSIFQTMKEAGVLHADLVIQGN